MQRLAALLSDGSTALFNAPEEEFYKANRFSVTFAPPLCSFVQRLAALLSDGSIALFAAPEEDFWGEPNDEGAGLAEGEAGDAEVTLQSARSVSPAAGAHDTKSELFSSQECRCKIAGLAEGEAGNTEAVLQPQRCVAHAAGAHHSKLKAP